MSFSHMNYFLSTEKGWDVTRSTFCPILTVYSAVLCIPSNYPIHTCYLENRSTFAHFLWPPGNCSYIKCFKKSYLKWQTPLGLGFSVDRHQALTSHTPHPRPDPAETDRWCLHGLRQSLGWLSKRADSCRLCSLTHPQPQNNAWHTKV